MNTKIRPKILSEYQRVMSNENAIRTTPWPENSVFMNSAAEIYRLTLQIVEEAKLSRLVRSYIKRYNMSSNQIAYESVAAHNNLVTILTDRALSYYYGPDFGEVGSKWPRTVDGYSYREIMETIRIHDLPENDIGDWPDNDSSNQAKKNNLEQRYFEKFFDTYPAHESNLVLATGKLFDSMEHQYSSTGRLLYLADKIAAIIMALCYDDYGFSPIIHVSDRSLSERDRKEIDLCDHRKVGYFKASEMWTIDYFVLRKIIDMDEKGFFTAITVMYTLMVKNGKWYSWREKDYMKTPS